MELLPVLAVSRQKQEVWWHSSLPDRYSSRYEIAAPAGGWQVANKTAPWEGGGNPEKGEFEEALKPWLWRRTQLPVAMTITT